VRDALFYDRDTTVVSELHKSTVHSRNLVRCSSYIPPLKNMIIKQNQKKNNELERNETRIFHEAKNDN
jgi:hypothetical protein